MLEDTIFASEQLTDEFLLEVYRIEQELLLYPDYKALAMMNEYAGYLKEYLDEKYA